MNRKIACIHCYFSSSSITFIIIFNNISTTISIVTGFIISNSIVVYLVFYDIIIGNINFIIISTRYYQSFLL